MSRVEDETLGTYVYCNQHVGVHTTGWCSVGNDQKLAIPADNADDARAWVRFWGLPMHGLCIVCYDPVLAAGLKTCSGRHSAEEVKAAERRRLDLRRYIYHRFSARLMQSEVTRVHGVDVTE